MSETPSEPTTGHQANQPDSPPPSTPSCPIQELQTAFPSILLATKEPPQNPYTRFTPQYPLRFSIFSLPSELRNSIYQQYLSRPKALIWHRLHNRSYRQSSAWYMYCTKYTPSGDPEILSLFLVSRRVYDEAFYVFCSTNAILIEKRKYTLLPNLLRVFPPKAADLLQRLAMEYYDYQTSRYDGDSWKGDKAQHTWERIIREAYVVKEYFPRVRRFTALWKTSPFHLSEAENKSTDYVPGEVQVERWMRWLRWADKGMKQRPPRWLYVKFTGPYQYAPIAIHQRSWDQALELLKEEIWTKETETGLDKEELNESGQKWLEEAWGDSRKQKRKGKRSVAGDKGQE